MMPLGMVDNMFKYLLLFLLLIPSIPSATTIVDENFDDQDIQTPALVYSDGGYCTTGCTYSTTERLGGTGYSLRGNHTGSDTVLILSGLQNYLENGIWVRYYLFYPTTYLFIKEVDSGALDNEKLVKIAGSTGWDIEWIYKNTQYGDGPRSIQLYWNGEDGTIAGNGTVTGVTPLTSSGLGIGKGTWHKVEYYLKLGTSYAAQEFHLQYDDYDVWQCPSEKDPVCNFRLPTSAYTGTQQLFSIRAGSDPPLGNGYFYIDNFTVVYNEGDLSDSEPGAPATCSDYNGDSSGCATAGCTYCSATATCGSSECCGDDFNYCYTQGTCEGAGFYWCAECSDTACPAASASFSGGSGTSSCTGGTGTLSFTN